jgi:glycerol-3-phosphate acyltransferase PlsX
VRIAVDLLGGDDAPAAVVDGALLALGSDPLLHLHLVGPADVVDQVYSLCPPADHPRLSHRLVGRRVGMADAPARAMRPDTTVRAGVEAVMAGETDALVSAGASGATVTAAVVGLGRLEGVRRPALAALIPAQSGPLVLLDVGASPDTSAPLLTQHAALGVEYARRVLGRSAIRVGLLNIGVEPGKGDRARRVADVALHGAVLPESTTYVGSVEGHDVPLGGRADVVVTDGFTGNILLKGIEGAYTLAGGVADTRSVPWAAALLGIAGTVVVCHGAATGPDIASGIVLAARLAGDPAVAPVPLVPLSEVSR